MFPFASRHIEGRILHFVTCFTYFYVIERTFTLKKNTKFLIGTDVTGTIGRNWSSCSISRPTQRYRVHRRASWSCLPWWPTWNRATSPTSLTISTPTSFSRPPISSVKSSESTTPVSQTFLVFKKKLNSNWLTTSNRQLLLVIWLIIIFKTYQL